ncbi:MAG TPA: adenylate/guanylate cyclase domain-containing protein [Capillimicrobium sp.]|nr:adenylate/guanylate cyclase domain-containing protein [Capillimicrobium sp.]
MSEGLSTAEVARQCGVTTRTLKRWVRDGVVPLPDGRWTAPAAAQARMVARLRARGHSLRSIREAIDSGRLAFGYVQDLFPPPTHGRSLEEASDEVGLAPALIERIFQTMGFSAGSVERLDDDDLQFLRYAAAVLAAGFPLVAFLQLARVYGQAIAQMADAEVRLFHLYVHEPMMRDGVPGLEMAEEMEGLAREILPLASPIMGYVHQRYLSHFLEQDVIGHMESDFGVGELDLGRLRVAIVFADLAGYTRLTEEQGDEEAVNAVERFIEAVEATLPDDARIIKTIGDEVMVVGTDGGALTDWAVGFQQLYEHRPQPRIGLHVGECVYRDGDYYGREVNLAARVAARAAGGEVIVTRPVVDAAGSHLEFERIGEVKLKGFNEPTELFAASMADG